MLHHDASRQRSTWRKAAAGTHAEPLLWTAAPVRWWRAPRTIRTGLVAMLLIAAAGAFLPSAPAPTPQATAPSAAPPGPVGGLSASPAGAARYAPAGGAPLTTGSIVRELPEPVAAAEPAPVAKPKTARKPKMQQTTAWTKFVRSVDKMLGLAK